MSQRASACGRTPAGEPAPANRPRGRSVTHLLADGANRHAGRRRGPGPGAIVEAHQARPAAVRTGKPTGVDHDSPRLRPADQAVRRGHRGGPAVRRHPPRPGDGLPRGQRLREDDQHARPAGADPAHVGDGDHRRAQLPRARPPGPGRGRGPRPGLPPQPERAPAPAHRRAAGGGAGPAGRGAADRVRPGRGGGPPGGRVLARHAAAPGAGDRADREPGRAGAGRAVQRAGPGGDHRVARLPAAVRRRRRHGLPVQPPAQRDRARGRRLHHHRPGRLVAAGPVADLLRGRAGDLEGVFAALVHGARDGFAPGARYGSAPGAPGSTQQISARLEVAR